MARGRLRVYLGAAPGVGKIDAMLGEGRRRLERGTDVVVGFVETHGRLHTAEMTEGLEIVSRRLRTARPCSPRWTSTRCSPAGPRWRWSTSSRTNVPGSRNEKRWQDVEELLGAGIDVVSTVNIQHLESVNDVVAAIVVPARDGPRPVVRAADQVELVDMAPEALRRRMAHGNVYAAEKVDAALSNYFRVGNLTALRELALLWTADKVDEALQTYRSEHEIEGTWETRERVVVALTGGRKARPWSVGRRGSPPGRPEASCSRSTSRARTASPAPTLPRSRTSDGSSSPSAVPTTRSSGRTCPRPCSRSPAPRTPPSWCSARAGGRGWPPCSPGPGIGATTIRDSGDIDVHIVTRAASPAAEPDPAAARNAQLAPPVPGLRPGRGAPRC